MKTFLNLIIIVLSIIGFTEASFITWEKMTGNIPPCQPGFQCATVLEHPMTNIGPVPLAALGMIFYAIFTVLAIKFYLKSNSQESEVEAKEEKTDNLKYLNYLSIVGVLFGAYLLILMAFIIQGWCLYCLISAIICILLFTLTQIIKRVK